MQGRLSNRVNRANRAHRVGPLFLTAVLWLCGVAVLFLVKAAIESVAGPINNTWIDLALVLSAYLFFFLLDPLQNRVSNLLRRRARRKSRSQQTSV